MVRWKTVFAAGATYIGVVVGAGFASGQEVLQFFGLLGPWGALAIALVGLGFGFFGYVVMDAGRLTRASSHVPVIRKVGGRWLGPILDGITTFFLFGALSAMVAGAGSALSQEFGFPWLVGSLFVLGVSVATVLSGFESVVAATSAVVPVLLAGVLVVSISVLGARGIHFGSPEPGMVPVSRYWPLAGGSYVSYNLIMSVPVLAALGSGLRSKKEAILGSTIGAVGLAGALFMVYLAIAASLPDIANYEIPMARMAEGIHRVGGLLYTGVFLAEVYTTAVSNLYGFAARIARPNSRAFSATVLVTGAFALWAGSAGFTTLVRVVYPAVGWAGSLLLGALFLHWRKGGLSQY